MSASQTRIFNSLHPLWVARVSSRLSDAVIQSPSAAAPWRSLRSAQRGSHPHDGSSDRLSGPRPTYPSLHPKTGSRHFGGCVPPSVVPCLRCAGLGKGRLKFLSSRASLHIVQLHSLQVSPHLVLANCLTYAAGHFKHQVACIE